MSTNRSFFSSPALLATLIAGLLLAACARDQDRIIAREGDTVVTASEFEAYAKFKRIPLDNDKVRQAALDRYVERKALAKAIQHSGRLDQAAVDAELADFRMELLSSRYFEQYLKDTVTDEAIANYYAAHAADYRQQRAHAAHIMVRAPENLSGTELQARQTQIQEIYSRLRAGADFAVLAQTDSEDKLSGKRGGDLGWLKQGAVDQAFSDALFALKPGEYSAPVRTRFGFHIIKLVEGPETVQQPLEKVRGEIRYKLANLAKAQEVARLLGHEPVEPLDAPEAQER